MSKLRRAALAAILFVCLGPSARAHAQSMQDLFLEWIATGGVNVSYALDDAQAARFATLVSAVNAHAGTALTPSRNVILYYVDLANVRNGAGLVGNGRAQWLAFLGVAVTPTGGTEILGLHAFTDNPALGAYFEARGLGGYVTVTDGMSLKWVLERSREGDTRTLKLRVDCDEALVHLDVHEMPLTSPTGVDPLNGIDFIIRNLPHAEVAIGAENSVQQFGADLATLEHDVNIRRLDVPVTLGAASVNLRELFPGHGGITRIRTESRFWRWWRQ